jgi:hypothetical protein
MTRTDACNGDSLHQPAFLRSIAHAVFMGNTGEYVFHCACLPFRRLRKPVPALPVALLLLRHLGQAGWPVSAVVKPNASPPGA